MAHRGAHHRRLVLRADPRCACAAGGRPAVGVNQAFGLSGPRAGYRRAQDLSRQNPVAFGGPGCATCADGGTVGGNARIRAVRFPAPAADCRADHRHSSSAWSSSAWWRSLRSSPSTEFNSAVSADR